MLSIIIPVHNEEKRIGRTLESYAVFFKEKIKEKKIDRFEILVVLNACEDKTIDIVKECAKRFKEIKFLNFIEGGKGFAVIQGFRNALLRGVELIGFVDADMATSPHAFYDLVKKIGNSGGAIASRGLKESRVRTSFTRKLTNRGFNLIVRLFLFLPYKDTQCGAKLFRKDSLKKVIDELGTTQWAFDIDLLFKLKKRKIKIKEIPTFWEDREGSKLNLLKVPFQMFASVVRLRLLYSPFNFIVRAYDSLLPDKVKIHNL